MLFDVALSLSCTMYCHERRVVKLLTHLATTSLTEWVGHRGLPMLCLLSLLGLLRVSAKASAAASAMLLRGEGIMATLRELQRALWPRSPQMRHALVDIVYLFSCTPIVCSQPPINAAQRARQRQQQQRKS